MQNNANVSYLAGKVFAALVPSGLPDYERGVNEAAVIAAIEGSVTFQRLFQVQGLQIVANVSNNEAEIRGDECDVVGQKFAEPDVTVNFDYLESLDLDAFGLATGSTKSTQAATPVPVVDELKVAAGSDWVDGTTLIFGNKNGDGTEVASITVTNNGVALTLGTDYEIGVNGSGQTFILNVLGSNITATGTGIEIDYTYTPNDIEYGGIKKDTIQLPSLVVKVVGCPDSQLSNKFNTHYVVDASLTGDWTIGFADVIANGGAVPASIGFAANKGGYLATQKERI